MGKEKEDSQKTKIAREETPVTDTLSARQRITASGQSTLELEQVQQQVSEVVLQELGYPFLFILVPDDKGRFFKGTMLSAKDRLPLVEQAEQALENVMHLKTSELRVPVRKGYSLAWDTILSSQVYITHNLHELGAPQLSKSLCSKIQKILGVETIAAVPLTSKQSVVGAMLIGTKQDRIIETEIDSLTAFANQDGMAIENVWLYRKLEQAYQELETTQRDLIEEKQQKGAHCCWLSAMNSRYPLPRLKPWEACLPKSWRVTPKVSRRKW